ncbi:hypothetical protein ACFE04_014749 [Oxalis oulophora]
MANYQHYRSQFGDTTFTKVFVGGLAWETPTEEMRRYFEQFGEILEAVIITDKNTGKSKGYGFVTFRDPDSARRSCNDPNPVIDGRRANCNIASLGRPKPSPPRGGGGGRSSSHTIGNVPNYQGSTSHQGGAPPYGAVAPSPLMPQPPLPPPPVIYPSYGYPTYSPEYGYHPAMYNPQMQQPQATQYYHHHQPQMYGTTSTSTMGNPYYYAGYSPRGTYGGSPHHQRATSYIYYPTTTTQMEGSPSFSTYFPPPFQPALTRHPFPPPSDSPTHQQHVPVESEAGNVTSSESPNTT